MVTVEPSEEKAKLKPTMSTVPENGLICPKTKKVTEGERVVCSWASCGVHVNPTCYVGARRYHTGNLDAPSGTVLSESRPTSCARESELLVAAPFRVVVDLSSNPSTLCS